MDLARFGQLIGDPARARMLARLLDGTQRPAGELARDAKVTPQTASSHLARLVEAGILEVAQQGRFRYYRIASTEVARALESLSALVPLPLPSRAPPALRYARICYDHLAGRLGVALAQGLAQRAWIEPGDGSFAITPSGKRGLESLGLALPVGATTIACIDWSERRFHLGGTIGAALTAGLFARGWLARARADRAVRLTVAGRLAFERELGVDCSAEDSRQSARATLA